jgi:hypothetical protein
MITLVAEATPGLPNRSADGYTTHLQYVFILIPDPQRHLRPLILPHTHLLHHAEDRDPR